MIERMSVKDGLSRREILSRIIGSGINISPPALNLLSRKGVNNRDIEDLIRKISFVPNFKSHITLEVLKHANFYGNEITDNPNTSVKENPLKENSGESKLQDPIPNVKNSPTSKNNLREKDAMDLLRTETQPEVKKKDNANLKANEAKIVSASENPAKLISEQPIQPQSVSHSNNEEPDIDSLSHDLKKNESQERNITAELLESMNQMNSMNEKQSRRRNIDSDSDSDMGEIEEEGELSEIESETNDLTDLSLNSVNTNKMKAAEIEAKKRINDMKKSAVLLKDHPSLSAIKPIARDVNDQIKILKDPTKNIFTSGTVEDFVQVAKDKYESLRIILQKNPDVKDLMTIRALKSQQNSGDVSFIGMVSDKRLSGESHNVRLVMEDPTDTIDVLVRNDPKNMETYEKMIYLLNDQVVYVQGYLKIDQQKKSRVIFANNVIWPDIPVSYRPLIPQSPVSMAFISDVHIGSKNFLPKLFERFTQYLRCEIGTERDQKEAGKIKYLIIGGDLVDGIGIYPNQEKELEIIDIFKQYKYAAELLSKIPDYIKIIYVPGNHEPVRKALPHPIVPKKYCQDLVDMGVIFTGDPCLLSLHEVKTLVYHGDSMIDMNMSIPKLSNEKPELAMKEFLKCRHLAPVYGMKTELAPAPKDWMVIDEVPHIFHTGHVHINAWDNYRGVLLLNSGCFQSQTSFMKSLGIVPTPGFPVIVQPENGQLNGVTLNLNDY
jgi:DNA polymerase II small subunit